MIRIPGLWRIHKWVDDTKKVIAIALAKKKRRSYPISYNHYLFADPRGGSTWLMEIIQAITNEPVVWEPFDIGFDHNPFKNLNFGWRQHIPEETEWEEAETLLDELFSGKILMNDFLHFSSISQMINSPSLLFKICRGSAFLPWLIKKYTFHYKPIYLIRHPFAVVSSQLRHPSWNYPFTEYTIPDVPFNEVYKMHKPFLNTIKTKEEALVAEWCMGNSPPLKHPENNKKWITINYEELVLHPEETINRVLTSWKMEYDLVSINFNKNSRMTKADSPNSTWERILHWQTQLSEIQIKRMGRVLDYFQMEVYDKEDPFPIKTFQ